MLLEVKNLHIEFTTSVGTLEALRDVSFTLNEGDALGFVGESGSGKSITSLALFDLLASNGRVSKGQVIYKGRNIFEMSEAEKQKLRGAEISMIFQDPMSSLNPCFNVEDQIGEVLKVHLGMTKTQARDRTIELLNRVGIPDPQSRLKTFPHELSGGMSQRVMIAMAMACNPKILIADEPTTALDVTIQKQILNLLQKLRLEQKTALILVSHDLGVIAQNTDRILVMYAGEVVEQGPSADVIRAPIHPYTEGLLKCLPALHDGSKKDFRLPTIPGIVPNLADRPPGCQLAPRCSYRQDSCEKSRISMYTSESRQHRCLYPLNGAKVGG